MPCFREGVVKEYGAVLSEVSGAMALAGVGVGVAMAAGCGVGAAFVRFSVAWQGRNYLFTGWSLARGALTIAAKGKDGVMPGVLQFVTPMIFAGYDFLMLLVYKESRWLLGFFRVFFVLTALSKVTRYVETVMERNACKEPQITGAATVLGVFLSVASAGQILSILKILYLKFRRILAPAWRYGVASHVLVSLPAADDPAVMVMSSVSVSVSSPRDSFGGFSMKGWRAVTFTSPPAAFTRASSVWGLACLAWGAVDIVPAIFRVAHLRANPLQKCWKDAPASPAALWAVHFIDNLAPGAWTLVFVSMVLLIRAHNLGRLQLAWTLFWVRRNWFFTIVCFLRGTARFTPGVGTLDGVATLIQSTLLPAGIALIDLLLLLRPSAAVTNAGRGFFFVVFFNAVASYIRALAFASPCRKRDTKTTPAAFVADKLQTQVLLFFSIMVVTTIFDIKVRGGVSVPVLNLSDEDRFSQGSDLPKQRMGRPSNDMMADNRDFSVPLLGEGEL